MKESLSQQTANLKHKNNRHKRWKGIVSILACMVVFCTVYALILPALTAEGTLHCGKEEHTHIEDCYEKEKVHIIIRMNVTGKNRFLSVQRPNLTDISTQTTATQKKRS